MAYTGTETNVNGSAPMGASASSMPGASSSTAAAASPTSRATKAGLEVGILGVAFGGAVMGALL